MAETQQYMMFLLLLSYLNFFAHAEVICPSAYTPSEESGTCLQFVYTETVQNTWSEARSLCQADGGDLVKIVNKAMNDLVYAMCTADRDFRKQDSDVQFLWIGLNDIEDEGTWVWLDETSPASWINWHSGQPNGGTAQNCGALNADYQGEWQDLECFQDRYWDMNSYVCEFPVFTTTTVTTTTTTTTTLMTTTTPEATTSTMNTSATTTPITTTSLVAPSRTSSGGLSVGAIAGIVIGVLVVVALVPAAFLAVRYFNNPQRTARSQGDHSVAYSNNVDDRDATVLVS